MLLGATGQLALTLSESARPVDCELERLGRAELDITDAAAVDVRIRQAQPDVVINTAAWTAVDAAETQVAAAHAVNADAVEHLAQSCLAHDAYLIHVSTDFVFSGDSPRPYRPEDPTGPVSVYGASKLAGEQALMRILPRQSCIIRTSWLYSAFGHNFLRTMLRLMGERDQLSVVVDQVGTPCSTLTLSDCIWRAVLRRPEGIFHWSDAGVASWYDFAHAIQEEALVLGLLQRAIPILPIPTSAYPTPARRPAFSVLDKSRAVAELGCTQLHWREALRQVLTALRATG